MVLVYAASLDPVHGMIAYYCSKGSKAMTICCYRHRRRVAISANVGVLSC